MLILVAGENPIYIYAEMLNGAFGTPRRIAETLVRTTPLLLGGLGIAIAFKTSTWNVGGPGQIYMGALGGTLVGIFIVGIPKFLTPMVSTEEVRAVAVRMDVIVESARKRDNALRLKETPTETDAKSIGERQRIG